MGLTIHREEAKPRLVRMGQADKVIERSPHQIAQSIETLSESLGEFEKAIRAAESKTLNQPPAPPKLTRGRPKMAKDKDLSDVSGVKTIREDDAGTKGAIGSHGVNAPAQEKVPEKPAEGNKEGE